MTATANVALPLVIMGAGGLARELYGWMAAAGQADLPVAFVQHDAPAQPQWQGVPICRVADLKGPVRYLLAVGAPATKRRLTAEADALGWQAQAYVHSTALVGLQSSLGRGTLVLPYCTVSSSARIGDFVTMNCRAAVGHDSVVGDYTTLLGSNCVNGNVQVGKDVVLGAACVIHPSRRIGDRATVGMGAVVVGHVKADTTVFGNPARRVGAA